MHGEHRSTKVDSARIRISEGPTEVRDVGGQTLGWFIPGILELPNGADASTEALRRAFTESDIQPILESWGSIGVDGKDA